MKFAALGLNNNGGLYHHEECLVLQRNRNPRKQIGLLPLLMPLPALLHLPVLLHSIHCSLHSGEIATSILVNANIRRGVRGLRREISWEIIANGYRGLYFLVVVVVVVVSTEVRTGVSYFY